MVRASSSRLASLSANFLSPPRRPDERSTKYYHYCDDYHLKTTSRPSNTDAHPFTSHHIMATALAVGVGVAAAAFFVRPSTINYAPKKILTRYRVVPVSLLFVDTVAVPVPSAKHSTRVDSRRR